VKGLNEIASIISRCTMREGLYHWRYEISSNDESKTDFSTLHISYRDALRTLYVKILSFQATSVCFLSKSTFERVTADMVKWNAWDTLLLEIEAQWRDMKYDEECKLQSVRHEQRMRGLGAIVDEVSRVRDVIKQAQNDNERKELLNWLSSVDPWTNYNSARRNHAQSTSNWLVEESTEFKKWEKEQNSFLWLHGQGIMTSVRVRPS
jgi:hypothetical protein